MKQISDIKKQFLETLNKEIEERETIFPTLVGWLYRDITRDELYKLKMIKSDIECNKYGF